MKQQTWSYEQWSKQYIWFNLICIWDGFFHPILALPSAINWNREHKASSIKIVLACYIVQPFTRFNGIYCILCDIYTMKVYGNVSIKEIESQLNFLSMNLANTWLECVSFIWFRLTNNESHRNVDNNRHTSNREQHRWARTLPSKHKPTNFSNIWIIERRTTKYT